MYGIARELVVNLRIVPSGPTNACQMKAISDASAFHPAGVLHCQHFGTWVIADGVSVDYRVCSQHLHRVLTILYTEHPGPFQVLPLRKPPAR